MYIHIGEDLTLRAKDIIAIIDKQSGDSSFFLTDEFLKRHEGIENNLEKKSYKSIVITNDRIYLSPYSSSTLKKRSNGINMQEW